MGNVLGISAKYVGMLERGEKVADTQSSLGILLAVQEHLTKNGMQPLDNAPAELEGFQESSVVREDPTPYGRKVPSERMIPVMGYAHAGLAENYEEIPEDWQDRIPATIRDHKAFAVRLEGDSMEPKFCAGDVLILKPSGEVYNGCLAVLKLKDDGFIFRRVERRAEFVRLIPLNPQWPTEELPNDHVNWIFPVWGMWRQILK
jgi:SOS-response transcriptional repressor LexA